MAHVLTARSTGEVMSNNAKLCEMWRHPLSTFIELTSPQLDSSTSANDGVSLAKNIKRLKSTDTAITAITSSDESSEESFGALGIIDAEAPKRHRFQRSLTDHEYNKFLDYLESPSICNPKKSAIPSQVITDQVQCKDVFLEFLDSPTRNPINRDHAFPHDDSDDDIEVPRFYRGAHPNHGAFDLSSNAKESTSLKSVTRVQSCQDLIALSALAALLGTNPSNPFPEKKTREIKNLWADDTMDDDDMISLPDDGC